MTPKSKCGVCGRRGRRECPALDGMICSWCCGAKRGSELECPSHCLHFPFGTDGYDLWLKVDGPWQSKLTEYVLEHVGQDGLKQALEHHYGKVAGGEEDFLAALSTVTHYLLIYHRDEEGKSLGDRWEAEGWRGLNNDERVMMRHRRCSYPAIVEIQRVVDEKTVECIDLFDPEENVFTVYDRGTASSVVRFSRFMTWVTHYPNFSRFVGGGLQVPDTIVHELCAAIMEQAETSEGDALLDSVRTYMAHHYADCRTQVVTLSKEHLQRAVRGMDAHECIAVYDITGSREAIIETIEDMPDFERNDEEVPEGDPEGTLYYHWLRRGRSKELEDAMPATFRSSENSGHVGSVGSLRLQPDKLVIQTFSKLKFGFAKELAEEVFREHLAFSGESVVDIAKQVFRQMHEQGESGPQRAVPDANALAGEIPLEVEQQVMEQFYRRHYTQFLDEPVPMLNDMTPRDAASDPKMRPQLVQLMKQHVHGIESMCREKGLKFSIDWVLTDLGLNELL